MTKAEKTYEFIHTSIAQGKTVYIATAATCKKVDQKTMQAWERAKVPLFKIDSVGALLMGRGKNYDCICTKNCLLVSVTAE